jgi:hypothetical protein
MPILEVQEVADKEPVGFQLVAEDGKIVRIPHAISPPAGQSLLDFLKANQEYMRQLAEFVEEYTTGLD